MAATHKLTVRLDVNVWEGFQKVCELNGSSVTALFQAWAEVMMSETERHGWKALPEWGDYPPAAEWLHQRAREIDAERRARPGNRGRSDAS